MAELKDLLEVLADDGRPRGADEVLRRARADVAHQRARSQRARRNGRILAAAAFLTVLATASSVVLFRQRDDSSEVASTGNKARIGTWQEVPFSKSGFEPGSQVNAIARDGQGLVAVGSIGAPIGRPVQAAWTSRDGRRWERASDATFGDGTIDLVTARGDGFVAFGSGSWLEEQDSRTVWRSKDGQRWERLTDAAPLGINSAIAGGPGLVAAGIDPDGSSPTRGAIWTSVRGKRWTAVPESERLFPRGEISGLAVDGDRVVAVGTDTSDLARSIDGQTAVWVSTDGTHWTRVREAGLENAAGAGSRLANQGGQLRMLAARNGASPTRDPRANYACPEPPRPGAIWASKRGRRWDRISKLGAAPEASQLVGSGDWLLAGGTRGLESCRARSVVYISSNGREWTKAKADPKRARSGRYLHAMSSTPDGAVVVIGEFEPGRDGGYGTVVWLWTAPE